MHQPDEVDRLLATLDHPLFAQAAPKLKGSGEGKNVLLYKAYKEVNGGRYPDYPAQQIGDCVSHAFGHGIDLLSAVQIATMGKQERFTFTATEPIYAMARVDVGSLRGSYSDGAVGAWAARAVSTLGTLSREVIGPYDGNRAREWGARGLPDAFKEQAIEHRVRATSLVTTFEGLQDALANGYPVTVGSSQGFSETRDADGFCAPEGRWDHAMLFVGVRDGSRPGACVFQSWGSQVPQGPLSLDQPSNSFWVDAHVVERMLATRDSWSISLFDGYPARALPPRWSYDGFA